MCNAKDDRLEKLINGQIENCLIPFFWQHGTGKDISIPEKMRLIYEDGIGAVCVESRPHDDFCGDGWWEDMDQILDSAEKLGMKVWLFDDLHYPTGTCANAISQKHPDLTAVHLVEQHIDVIGPINDGMILLSKTSPDDMVLGVYAYLRTNENEDLLEDVTIDLTHRICGDYVFVTLPSGCYRIFTLLKTKSTAKKNFFDIINPKSVQVLIDEVYEPHYRRYSKYFGNVFAGFFSDEPAFQNGKTVSDSKSFKGFYHMTVGVVGAAFPWSEEIGELMQIAFGEHWISKLPALWYQLTDQTGRIRHAYMNAVTDLYAKHFSQKIGKWCSDHGVAYIGHVIEDMDTHARLGSGAGHYFKAMSGQDMAGMDIVLHQVLPGFAHLQHASYGGYFYSDAPFSHYVLGQLAASQAHLSPKCQGRAMCEVFGAYGWAEGLPTMKWLADFLLVRGINYFVPHAYSDKTLDLDCPPHFGLKRNDPQAVGFSTLTRYMNRMSYLLRDGVHVSNVAILYHAESEWMNGIGNYMPMSKPAKELYDAHVCYDILPSDYLPLREKRDDGFVVNGELYRCLVVPYAKELPQATIEQLNQIHSDGMDIVFVDAVPDGISFDALAIPLSEIAKCIIEKGYADVKTEDHVPLLRHYHVRRNNADIFMFFQEDVVQPANATFLLPCKGDYVVYDGMREELYRAYTADGRVSIKLKPYQSCVLIFNGCDPLVLNSIPQTAPIYELLKLDQLHYKVFLKEMSLTKQSDEYFYKETSELFNVNSAHEIPSFSGKIRYQTVISVNRDGDYLLDLGNVGQTAELYVNGQFCGNAICAPYQLRFQLQAGDNQIEIIVSNTLANTQKDRFSKMLLIPPSGLLGPLQLYYKVK